MSDGRPAVPRSDYLFTSESVSEGHPDKVCDRISDAVVDAFLAADPVHARVACETLATTRTVVIAGEVRDQEISWIRTGCRRKSRRWRAMPSGISAMNNRVSTGVIFRSA